MRALRFFVLIAGLTLHALAQEATQEPGARLQEMQQRLQLTEEQKAQLRPILQEEVANLRAIRDKYEGKDSRRSRLQMARELRDAQSAIDKRVNPILTKQQREEWKKLREERREQLKEQKGR